MKAILTAIMLILSVSTASANSKNDYVDASLSEVHQYNRVIRRLGHMLLGTYVDQSSKSPCLSIGYKLGIHDGTDAALDFIKMEKTLGIEAAKKKVREIATIRYNSTKTLLELLESCESTGTITKEAAAAYNESEIRTVDKLIEATVELEKIIKSL